MWRANGNPNPCTDHDKVLHANPHLSKKGGDPSSLCCLGLGGLKPYKLKDTFFYKTKGVQQVAN